MHQDERLWYKNWPCNVQKHLAYPNVALFELLTRSAEKYPRRIALASPEEEITYEQLDALSEKFASVLVDLGLKKGDCVALFLPNIPQFVVAYYGVLKAGGVLTTISPMYREREVEHQLRDSEAATVVALDSLLPIIEAVWQKTFLRNVITTDLHGSIDAPFLDEKKDVYSFQELMGHQKTTKILSAKIDPVQEIAALQYTGGTTGTTKAAMLSHFNLVSNAVAFAAWIRGAEAQETFLTVLPLFHIYGMTTSLNAPVSLAAKIVLLPRFEPLKVLDVLQRHKVTVFCGVPTVYQALLASPQLGKFDLTSVRVCISGASSLPPLVQKKFMEITGGLLAEGYGLTEASPVTHCSPVDKTMKTVRVGSIGLPLPDTEARIVDAETGTKTVNVGEVGELAVSGPQIMKGYWKQSEETAKVLRDGWLLTGDIARMDAEGYFYITDRKKDLIKYKDFSVYPREIEDVCYEHPAVHLCSVVGKPDADVGEIPKAFVVLKESVVVSDKELMAFVNGKVAPYKAVREVEFRKELPMTPAGKVMRMELRDEARKVAARHNL